MAFTISVKINGLYIGWVESAGGNTYIASSVNGEGDWTVGDQVGGATAGAAPLSLYFFPGITGPKPSGNFVLIELDGQLTYAKIYLAGDYSGAYLAINPTAAQAATPALAEAAFMNPDDWTWRDGTIGLPDAADTVISNTTSSGGHDIREGWTVPTSNYQSNYVFLYTADYSTGTKGLGYLVGVFSGSASGSGENSTGGGAGDGLSDGLSDGLGCTTHNCNNTTASQGQASVLAQNFVQGVLANTIVVPQNQNINVTTTSGETKEVLGNKAPPIKSSKSNLLITFFEAIAALLVISSFGYWISRKRKKA